MSEFDKKLEYVCATHIDDGGNTNYIALTKAIKQAFIDAGWLHLGHNGTPIRTGQEWYERFLDEFPRAGLLPELQEFRSQAIEAAMRASGISEGEL